MPGQDRQGRDVAVEAETRGRLPQVLLRDSEGLCTEQGESLMTLRILLTQAHRSSKLNQELDQVSMHKCLGCSLLLAAMHDFDFCGVMAN